MVLTPNVEASIGRISGEFIERLQADMELYFRQTIPDSDIESPIEAILWTAFHLCDWQYWGWGAEPFGQIPRDVIIHHVCDSLTEERLSNAANKQERLYIVPQFKIGQYRADFAIIAGIKGKGQNYIEKLAIECDGHEFHEKTKEQAARDKARDRYLQSQGWAVFRFSGSEITKDPIKCANEVAKHLSDSAFKRQ